MKNAFLILFFQFSSFFLDLTSSKITIWSSTPVPTEAIIPAMAAGNSVILKHSAQTPLCAEQLYQSAKKTLPKNVFNYLHLNHEDGLKVVSDKRINFVSFTGSV